MDCPFFDGALHQCSRPSLVTHCGFESGRGTAYKIPSDRPRRSNSHTPQLQPRDLATRPTQDFPVTVPPHPPSFNSRFDNISMCRRNLKLTPNPPLSNVPHGLGHMTKRSGGVSEVDNFKIIRASTFCLSSRASGGAGRTCSEQAPPSLEDQLAAKKLDWSRVIGQCLAQPAELSFQHKIKVL